MITASAKSPSKNPIRILPMIFKLRISSFMAIMEGNIRYCATNLVIV